MNAPLEQNHSKHSQIFIVSVARFGCSPCEFCLWPVAIACFNKAKKSGYLIGFQLQKNQRKSRSFFQFFSSTLKVILVQSLCFRFYFLPTRYKKSAEIEKKKKKRFFCDFSNVFDKSEVFTVIFSWIHVMINRFMIGQGWRQMTSIHGSGQIC